MSVVNTIRRLQELHAAIPGVTMAPTVYPIAINAAQCPCAVVYPGPAVWRHETMGEERRHDRTYVVRVFVKPFNLGAGVDEALQLVNTLLFEFGKVYTEAAHQPLDDSPQTIIRPYEEYLIDTGYNPDEPLLYMGEIYHGFEFQVGISEVD